MPPRTKPHSTSPGRRGTVYVLVLAVASLVLTIGLGGLAVARSTARTLDASDSASIARRNARSAIEIGTLLMAKDSSWRKTRANGKWLKDIALGQGTFTLEVVNPSGDLNRDPTDPVVLTGTGKHGKAVQSISVTLQPDTSPLTCMQVPCAAGSLITFGSATVNGNGGTITSNAAVTALLGSINANIEATLTATGLTFNGTIKSLVAARTFPGSDVFDPYLAGGAAITVSSIPKPASARLISKVLISPTSQPYGGTTNSRGIYTLDCKGDSLTIQDCRIVGTLVVLNAPTVTVQGSVCWEPATANYPCLMVQGNLALSATATSLTESTAGLSLNPAGTPFPYPTGTADTDKSDSYPSQIMGLVYASGNVTTSNAPSVNNLIIGGALTTSGTLNLFYDSAYSRSPPPGFTATGSMRPVLGTYTQVVY